MGRGDTSRRQIVGADAHEPGKHEGCLVLPSLSARQSRQRLRRIHHGCRPVARRKLPLHDARTEQRDGRSDQQAVPQSRRERIRGRRGEMSPRGRRQVCRNRVGAADRRLDRHLHLGRRGCCRIVDAAGVGARSRPQSASTDGNGPQDDAALGLGRACAATEHVECGAVNVAQDAPAMGRTPRSVHGDEGPLGDAPPGDGRSCLPRGTCRGPARTIT